MDLTSYGMNENNENILVNITSIFGMELKKQKIVQQEVHPLCKTADKAIVHVTGQQTMKPDKKKRRVK